MKTLKKKNIDDICNTNILFLVIVHRSELSNERMCKVNSNERQGYEIEKKHRSDSRITMEKNTKTQKKKNIYYVKHRTIVPDYTDKNNAKCILQLIIEILK